MSVRPDGSGAAMLATLEFAQYRLPLRPYFMDKDRSRDRRSTAVVSDQVMPTMTADTVNTAQILSVGVDQFLHNLRPFDYLFKCLKKNGLGMAHPLLTVPHQEHIHIHNPFRWRQTPNQSVVKIYVH